MKYYVNVCKPHLGVRIVNKLEQQITPKYWYEPYEDLPSYVTDFYTVTEDTPYVVCGTQGELWCISEDTLISQYTLDDGSPITKEYLAANDNFDWIHVMTITRKE